ncbi:hypothetical protein [Massilia sp. Dwa41.01b]|uniref:hypothetical protein n=1 Tax=Massilia sp. Dwa41.01b TaxID=2709302 RepID=UPI001E40C9FA|nr:hypothetical protein [Massilia sp. Dwa41.01b]
MFRGVAFSLALALAGLGGTTGAAVAEAPKGSLVIIGGGLRAENAAVWDKIVVLAGGRGRASRCSRPPPKIPSAKAP